MKLEGSVALVVGAGSDVGTAIVGNLLARGAARVYAASIHRGGESRQAGAVALFVDQSKPAYASALARDLGDVTLLVNCMVADRRGEVSFVGSDTQPLGRRLNPVGGVVKLIDAFAPVLAANGGGAVVNVLSVFSGDQPTAMTIPKVSRRTIDWMLADGLRDRLAAKRTQLVYLRAHLAIGTGDQEIDDQRALAGHVAARVLDRLEMGDRSRRPQRRVADRQDKIIARAGRRQASGQSD